MDISVSLVKLGAAFSVTGGGGGVWSELPLPKATNRLEQSKREALKLRFVVMFVAPILIALPR